jgi:putative phosphoribosyl transferase
MDDVVFADRRDAGRRLASELTDLKGSNPLVLALPRGGVPVAHEIAQTLGAQLDLLMVRKIGVPWQPELALAAVVDGGHPETVVNDEVARLIPVPPDYLQRQTALELREIEAQRERFLKGRPPIPIDGRVVIVVDDGIATGATVRVALKAVRRHRPARLVVATPVAPPSTLEYLITEADDVVCLSAPEDFAAVGVHYADFAQVSDDEVIAILDQYALPSNADDTDKHG